SAAPTGTVTNAYQGDQDGIGTDWKKIEWSIEATADEPNQRLSFDIGKAANTYFIDDVEIIDAAATGGGGGGGSAEMVEAAMSDFITASVSRYAGTVKAWDVVNEPITEAGALRTSGNTTIPSTADANDYFFWADHLDRDYILRAFQYAAVADPDALLFINDYNLESNATKLDSLITLVNEMKGKGAKIDGIGTQMHLSWSTSRAGIDAMFQKLAATGLQIRISELDVKVNPGNKQDFMLTPQFEAYQASMFEYAIKSYLKHIPPAQQHGITIWGISDNLSWLYNGGKEFPLLYNDDFSKKAAYGGVLNAMK
ncbi:MAG TPA: endo-1,4-beta-xylanase, partial [Chitinophagaceae bacterium]|nr:endo-1,4-beta-xylanase [Chitinophagaceae bacterium]